MSGIRARVIKGELWWGDDILKDVDKGFGWQLGYRRGLEEVESLEESYAFDVETVDRGINY